MQTHVVAIVASKGGCSKTSLATACAVRAAKGGAKVALLDADPQGSLVMWWRLRGEPDNPQAFEVERIASDVSALRDEDWDWIIIDGPPSNQEHIAPIVRASDFVLIPCRVSAFDLDAVTPVVDACKRIGRPFTFVLTQVDPKWEKFTASAIKALKARGSVLAEQMRFRLAYASAVTIGKTAPESADSRQAKEAREEIEGIWQAVCKRMGAKADKVAP